MNFNKNILYHHIFYMLIIFTFLLSFIKCQNEENINELLTNIYNKINFLPKENKLYYRINKGICIKEPKILNNEVDEDNEGVGRYYCLINNNFYLLKGEGNYDNVFNISNQNENFYDLNIYKNNSNQLNFIISYINNQNSCIEFIHYDNNYNNKTFTYYIDKLSYEVIYKSLSCQILDIDKFYCFYYLSNSTLFMNSFNISNNFILINKTYIQHNDLRQDDGKNIIRTLLLNIKEIIVCPSLNNFIVCSSFKIDIQEFSIWTKEYSGRSQEIDIFKNNNDIIITRRSFDSLEIFSYNNDTLSNSKTCSFDNNFQLNLYFYFFTYDISHNVYKLITNLNDLNYHCNITGDNNSFLNNVIE